MIAHRIRALGRLDLADHALLLGVFLATYLSIRPWAVFVTISDLLILAAGVLMLLTGRLILRPFGSATGLWFIGLALLLGGLFISSLNSGALERWALVGVQYLFCLLVLPLIFLSRGAASWRRLAKAFVLGIVAMELVTFAVIMGHGASYPALSARFGYAFFSGSGRVGAFFGDPNQHAAIISMGLPYLFYLRGIRAVRLLPFLAGLGILVTALFWTASVTGFAAALAASLVYFVLTPARASLPALIGVASLGFTLLAFDLPLPSSFEERVLNAVTSGNVEEAGTFTGRTALIAEAWEVASDTTFLGVGVDQYRVVSSHEAPVHNTFLLLWTEGGFVSLLGWLVLLAVLAFSGLSALPRQPREAALALSVLVGFVMFSQTAAHMYARVWMLPVILALAPPLRGLQPGGLLPRAVPQGAAP